MPISFGAQLRGIVARAGLSQEAFGDSVGVSRHAVGRWFSDQGQPEPASMRAILLNLKAHMRTGEDVDLALSWGPLRDSLDALPEATRMLVASHVFHRLGQR